MKIYEVISTNIDVNDGVFSEGLYANLHDAINKLGQHVNSKSGSNVQLDLEGSLETFNDKSLEYVLSKDKPAIYYRSKYGNYRMVVYVQEKTVN
jgi:hypothetical protein